ncbi:carboxypeptidase-like regulatory domain-containing protein [Chitinophagaceae bacterium LB-8]|uniref:Carboxypeptidase-like regulatory domain-containing protein n=1 Tax=Paraflavisolibacter caeni TaxID=2982496 RepID=A0A9X2XUW9_9BACT|nr:STN and carboxypeptidase regulatory-like domain-containing protein [Paraflavisolibacter caeni]MCU7548967.1 carboxypeptidase-like regulatory domain-containing protein [Paraflavisolibacter caeni]
MKNSAFAWKAFFLFLCFSSMVLVGMAQSNLNKVIPLSASNQRIDNVLEILSNRGNFYFSYNSSIIKRDSVVSIDATNKTVKQILDELFGNGYEFKESGNYIIIRRAPVKLTMVTNKAVTEDKSYVVSGYVLDDNTGAQIENASIYEKKLLVSALTNENGYFKLRLKNKAKSAALTVSKEFYEDTTVFIEPKYNQQITITLLPLGAPDITIVKPEDYFVPDSLRVRITTPSGITEYTYVKSPDSARLEKTAVGKFLISSAQKFQSLNLKKFLAERPFQVSLTPGLSTHGKMSGQVVNNVSFNVFGGYAGGVDGFELGGLFNLDKQNAQYAQIAGLFNIVGGNVKGVQIGGISNTVLGDFNGLQIGGINNFAKKGFNGFQLAGVHNHTPDSVKGLQIAGVSNFSMYKTGGVQISGVANMAHGNMDGVQISGVFNYTKRLRGLQIGLINIADTSEGYSLGLVNIILKGYHKLSFSSNDITNVNAAYKSGNRKLYSILQAGANLKENEKVYTFGYGLGSDWPLTNWLYINPELSANYLYLGAFDYVNILSKANLHLNFRLSRNFSIFAGPTFNAYYTDQDVEFKGYKFPVPDVHRNTFKLHNKVVGWIGWNVGINLF